jgi:hypothetical protein
VEPEEDSDHADADRAHERGREEDVAVAHPPRGS